MEIERYIRKIVNDGDRREMEELSDILVEVVDIIKKYDEDCYKEYKYKLRKMAYGDEITEEEAREIVRNMRPEGERWNIEQTSQMQRDYGYENIDSVKFYLVANQGFNDYREVFGDNLETYIRYTEAFINDPDAGPHKVEKYFLIIPK